MTVYDLYSSSTVAATCSYVNMCIGTLECPGANAHSLCPFSPSAINNINRSETEYYTPMYISLCTIKQGKIHLTALAFNIISSFIVLFDSSNNYHK